MCGSDVARGSRKRTVLVLLRLSYAEEGHGGRGRLSDDSSCNDGTEDCSSKRNVLEVAGCGKVLWTGWRRRSGKVGAMIAH